MAMESYIRKIIRFILSKVYLVCGNAVFRQLHGIPMGGGASGLLANIALSHKEILYVEKFPTTPIQHCIWRYADDFSVVNCERFKTLYHLIYPPETGVKLIPNVLVNKDDVLTYTHFLDVYLFVSIHSNEVFTTLYDKREDKRQS